VHLVGFVTKKFVTMHGHMNVRKITWLFWFSFLFFPKTFLILKGAKRADIINVRLSSCEVPIISIKFYWTCMFSTDFLKIIKRHLSRRSIQWELTYSMQTENKTDMQKDIRDETKGGDTLSSRDVSIEYPRPNSRFSQFCKRAYEWTIFMTTRGWNSLSAVLKINSKRRSVGLILRVTYLN
jgi:hypothetical protein